MTKKNKIIVFLFILSSLFYLSIFLLISYPMTTLFKPIPIFLLVGAVWLNGNNRREQCILCAALFFSMIGDEILTLPFNWSLQGGIASFMVAHFVYIFLFLKDFKRKRFTMIYAATFLALDTIVFFYLFPYARSLIIPIGIYMLVLTTMVFTTLHTTQKFYLIACGGVIFLFSDLMLAMNEFVLSSYIFSVLVMFSYYIAQSLLVTGVILRSRAKVPVKSINTFMHSKAFET